MHLPTDVERGVGCKADRSSLLGGEDAEEERNNDAGLVAPQRPHPWLRAAATLFSCIAAVGAALLLLAPHQGDRGAPPPIHAEDLVLKALVANFSTDLASRSGPVMEAGFSIFDHTALEIELHAEGKTLSTASPTPSTSMPKSTGIAPPAEVDQETPPETTEMPAAQTKTVAVTHRTTEAPRVECPVCTPAERPVPTLVIPFYERDICKMKVTAKSISVNDRHGVLGAVYLMWISKHTVEEFQEDLDEIQKIIAESHEVRLFDFHWLVDENAVGWQVQQVLKLKIAQKVESDFYIVADSKNAIVRGLNASDFFSECNQAKTFARYGPTEIPEPHSGWYEKSASCLGVDPPHDGEEKWPTSITPMTLHRDTVLSLLSNIDEDPDPDAGLCQGQLCDMIDKGATEFTLYQMFAHRKVDMHCIHSIEAFDWDSEPAVSLWRGEAGNAAQMSQWSLEATQRIVDGSPAMMFGGQAGALDAMPSDMHYKELEALSTIFQGRGLFDPTKTWDDLADCIIGPAA